MRALRVADVTRSPLAVLTESGRVPAVARFTSAGGGREARDGSFVSPPVNRLRDRMLIKNGYVHSLHALIEKISANEGAGPVWKWSAALRSLTQRIYRSISNSDQATLRPKNAG